MAIVKTPSSSKKTKKRLKVVTNRNPGLDKEWELLLAKHSKPLEKGAKAKGVKLKETVAAPQLPLGSPPDQSFNLEKMTGSTAKPTPKVYTGSAVVGIATLHKSNAIPVFSADEAKDVAKMRRN